MPEVMSIEVDEEFDPRPPQTPFGLRGPDGRLNIPLIAGVAIAILLVVMLIFVVVKPFSAEKPPVVSSWKPNDPTENLQAIPVYPANDQMVSSLQRAMETWAKFYTTGKLEDLAEGFDLAGSQYAQLAKEQPTVVAAPDPGAPAVIDLGPVGKVSQKDRLYTIRLKLTWTKPGQPSTDFNWDVVMKKVEEGYVINTVRETGASASSPLDFCSSAALISELDNNDKVSKELEKFPSDRLIPVYKSVLEVRLKTWKFLQQNAAGTPDQEQVDEIIAEYNTLLDKTKEATSIKQISETANEIDNEDSRKYVVDRVEEECGLNIEDR